MLILCVHLIQTNEILLNIKLTTVQLILWHILQHTLAENFI